jgi:hypothetical protein
MHPLNFEQVTICVVYAELFEETLNDLYERRVYRIYLLIFFKAVSGRQRRKRVNNKKIGCHDGSWMKLAKDLQ